MGFLLLNETGKFTGAALSAVVRTAELAQAAIAAQAAPAVQDVTAVQGVLAVRDATEVQACTAVPAAIAALHDIEVLGVIAALPCTAEPASIAAQHDTETPDETAVDIVEPACFAAALPEQGGHPSIRLAQDDSQALNLDSRLARVEPHLAPRAYCYSEHSWPEPRDAPPAGDAPRLRFADGRCWP